MLSIHTKYLSPTETKGARVKAYSYDGRSVTISFDYSLECVESHHKAAKAFIAKHLVLADGEDGSKMVYGSGHDRKGFVFCFSQSTIEG